MASSSPDLSVASLIPEQSSASARRITLRSVVAAALTGVAIALMIVSTILFLPVPWYEQPPLIQATAAAIGGGIALLIALWLSTHKVQAQRVAEQGISAGRINWLLLIPGLILLAFGTEVSAEFMTNGS